MNGESRKVLKRLSGDLRVRNFDELYEILDDHMPHQFAILLNFGIVSRRTIQLVKSARYKPRFLITSHFDGSQHYETKWELEVGNKDNISEAIRKGAFLYEPEG